MICKKCQRNIQRYPCPNYGEDGNESAVGGRTGVR